MLVAAVFVELLIYGKWSEWWGGVSFGYRIILKTIPALVILPAIGWQEWAHNVAGRIALAVVPLDVQWLGDTYYACGLNVEPNLN